MDWTVRRDPAGGDYRVLDFSLTGIDVQILLRGMAQAVLAEGRATVADVIPHFRDALRGLAPRAPGVEGDTGVAGPGVTP